MRLSARPLSMGALVLALLLGAVVATRMTGHTSDVPIVATFDAADGLVVGNDVRSSGVPVGTITGMSVQGGKARVELSVDPAVLPLHQDATLKIRPTNLLGEDYIDLNPGAGSSPAMQAPYYIRDSNTSSSVTLEQVINTLNDPTAAAAAALITSLGQGMKDSGGAARAALAALSPSLTDTTQLGKVLSGQNAALQQLIDRLQPVLGGLSAGAGAKLDRLVAQTEQTLATVAANRQAMQMTLADLPQTLRTARVTLARLSGIAQQATPLLQSVRPTTDNVNQISGELNNFAGAADPALQSLPPLLRTADELLKSAAPVVRELVRGSSNLRTSSHLLKPLGAELLNSRAHLNDVLTFVKWWSLSTNGSDALSHYFRGVVFVSPDALRQLINGGVPGLGSTLIPKVPGLGGLTNPTGTLKGMLGSLTSGLKLPGLLGGRSTTSSSGATGLNPSQEQSLLGQLIGGL